jgi:hypothetical protein
MSPDRKIDVSVLDDIIVGRVEPNIYAFSTNTVPNYLKVGDTYRAVEVRLNEWRKHFPTLRRVFSEPAKADEETYFRDLSVHAYLESQLGKKRLEAGKFPSIHYSREFFENTDAEDLKSAIKHIKESHKRNLGEYQFYRFETSLIPEAHTYKRVADFKPRPNQQETIDRFKVAVKNGRNKLLMYAVMRFGKSFTSMCCATEMKANLVVIVSAKSDVKEEWKATIEQHKRFISYEFLDSNALLDHDAAITERLAKGKKAAVFLTLQDLQGSEIKTKHKEIFGNQIDLLIVDETHFGARATEYGKVLSATDLTTGDLKNELKLADDDLSDLEKTLKVLRAQVTLHLSGTPYRILMGSEFTSEDIIAFFQFTDIADSREKWDEENLYRDDAKEWENPYYGFPQMVRFAFNPNETARKKLEELRQHGFFYAFSALFKPKSIRKDTLRNHHKSFEHKEAILDLLRVIDGSKEDDNLLGFLNYEKIKDGNMCRHIVCVLPYRASCDALEHLLKEHKDEFKNLSGYQIVNIAGVESEGLYQDTIAVKSKIKSLEAKNIKTITLTVNRMMTGATVEEWDTMLYFKDTASPQEYDQAIYRLQNQYIKEFIDENGDAIKYNMKPQTLLVDFDPNRMFRMQEQKSQFYNVNTDATGNTKLRERIERELRISPIVALNNKKIVRVEPANILDAVRKYSSDRSVLDEASVIPVDLSLLENYQIRSEIEKQGAIGSRQGLELEANEGEDSDLDVDLPQDEDDETDSDESIEADAVDVEANDADGELKRKFAMYYAKILFFSFLTPSQVNSLQDIVGVIDQNAENRRIARSLDLNRSFLTLFHRSVNAFILSRLDYKIHNINSLADDKTLKPIERASNALKKFSRLSDSEIVTPEPVAESMVDLFEHLTLNNKQTILDIASKQGEFAYAFYRKYGRETANLVYAITTSKVAYEFTRKVYELLELDITHVEMNYTSYDLIDQQKLTAKDGIKIGNSTIKPDIVIGGPPFQKSDGGGRESSAVSIYHHFILQARALNPRYISMIIPARWYSGGKGLDEFRAEMLNDKRLAQIHDFPETSDIFPRLNVRGGVCYFLWDREHNGDCNVINYKGGKIMSTKLRPLLEPDTRVFIRYNEAIQILRKVKKLNEETFDQIVSPRKPFGLASNFSNFQKNKSARNNIVLYRFGNNGYVNKGQVKNNKEWLTQTKVLVSKASPGGDSYPHQIISKPIVAGVPSCCTETYLVAGTYANEKMAKNAAAYMETRFFRFLMALIKNTQNISRGVFAFVPIQNFNKKWTDERLFEKYRLTTAEIKFIDTLVRPMH